MKLFSKISQLFSTLAFSLFALLIVISPILPTQVAAESLLGLDKPSLILCGATDKTSPAGHPCTFADLFQLGVNVIKFIFFLSIPAAVLGFSYAGWLYITAAGDSGKVSQANQIFSNVMWGFIWICAAWVVVYTIVTPFLNTPYYSLFNLSK